LLYLQKHKKDLLSMKRFTPACLPAAVGSFPHLHPYDAVELALQYLPEIPLWPQLPNTDYLESMYIQFSGGIPFVNLDPEKSKMHMDLQRDIYGELEKFYERVIEEDLDYFAIERPYARGFKAFMDRLWRTKPESVKWVKGQVTGPVSFGLMITDHRKRAIIYNEEVFDAVLKSLVLKTRWQVQQLKRLKSNVIIFIDEPYLSSFGSAFINLTKEQVLQYLGEVIDAVHQENAIAGIHCCGNTDWSLVMETETDIINFDAYDYFQGMTLYIDELKRYLKKGGVLAWGIVPTLGNIEEETSKSLTANFFNYIDILVDKGVSRSQLLKQCLITPSCGMGTMKYSQAELVLQLLSETSLLVRKNIASKKRKKAV